VNILRYLRQQAKEYECTVCGASHARSEIKLVGRVEAAWIVRVVCASCETEFRLLVVVDAEKASSPKQDHPSASRRSRAPVTVDEVLDAHEFLRTYSGGFNGLLPPPPGQRPTERRSDQS
jgi:hypothetical protein